MRLIYRIILNTSLVLIVLLTVWASLFYYAMMDELNDEVDDTLENYSELVIMRSLSGLELPQKNEGSNNSYYITPISKQQADSRDKIAYLDSMIYIPEKREDEPARILKTVYRNEADEYFELTVSIPTIEKQDLIEAIFYWIIALYVGLLLTIIIVNVIVFHSSLRPLYRLLKWLDNYVIGGKNVPLRNDTKVTEFKQLNEATLRHVERTEIAFEQQKQFIGNASHEMQTPLAICDNRLEWLVDNTELSEEQVAEILKTKQTLSYLEKLNRSLLFLSKIDNGQFPESDRVNINALVKGQLEDYREVYASKNIQVELKELNELSVQANEMLMTSLLTNLIKNAFVNTEQLGKIAIVVDSHSLRISNNGVKAPLDKDKIFQRFYQGGVRKAGSTGLGLAIVGAICKLYGICVAYDYVGDEHCFTLKWVR